MISPEEKKGTFVFRLRIISFSVVSRESGTIDLKFVFVSRNTQIICIVIAFLSFEGENPIFEGRIHQREIDQHKN